MHIYLMRHAEAVEPNAWTGSDRNRPLSDHGEARLRAAVKSMRSRRITADALLTSPYERANQTAEIVADELHILQTLQCPELAAGARPDVLRRLIGAHAAASVLWIVGHMPDVSAFAARLTGDNRDLERGFAPGEMLAVDCPVAAAGPDTGRTLWRRRLDDWMAA